MSRPEMQPTDGGAGDTKVCPYCAETIKAAAIRCRYCQSDLPEQEAPAARAEVEEIEVLPGPVTPDEQPAARTRPRSVVVAVAAVSLVLTAVFGGLAFRAWSHTRSIDEAEAAARTVRASVPDQLATLLSYDYETFDDDRAAAEDLLTDDFAEEYLPTLDAIKERAVEQKRSQQAQVVAVAVVDASADEVETLVFLNRTTSTEGSTRTRILQDRANVTLIRDGDVWKIADITFPTA